MTQLNCLEVEELQSLESIKHGFFGRNGGMSKGFYASLNCGLGSDDDPEVVQKNRSLVAQSFNLDSVEYLAGLYQIHGGVVDVVTKARPYTVRPKADALVSNTPGIALSVLTADCCPVLFADNANKVVGAAHAGWKGAKGRVVENTILAMQDLGAKKENITAIVGPSIMQQSYEVDSQFYQNFLDDSPEFDRFFKAGVSDQKYQFDLPGFVAHKLDNLGLNAVNFCGIDTYANEDGYFSYRRATHRSEPNYGRNISVIMLNQA